MDEERRERFDYELSAPLPGHDPAVVTEQVAEIEGEAFMTAMFMAQQQKAASGGTR